MFALVAALALTAPPAGRTLAVEPAGSTVTFLIVHKLHEVNGRTQRVEGRAVVQPDGKVLAMARVPVATFDSGDSNRDAHMREAIEAGRFPFAVVKGIATIPAGALDGSRPAAVEVTLAGEVELHGVKRPVQVPLTVTFEPGGAARVRGEFTVGLEAHGVERPSLLFVKVEDACRIRLDLLLREVKP